jgi:hypothetical protein
MPYFVFLPSVDCMAKVIRLKPARRAASIAVTTDWWVALASALITTTVSGPALAPSVIAASSGLMLFPLSSHADTQGFRLLALPLGISRWQRNLQLGMAAVRG